MVVSKKKRRKDCPLYTPPFCFGCHDFVNSSTAKRNATFYCAHIHSHVRHTLNNELMNKTKNI